MVRPTRRRFLLSGAAALSAPALMAQTAPRPFADQARGLDQLHALVVARADRVVFAEAFRGAGLERTANIKSVSKTLVALLTGVAIDKGHLTGPAAPVLPLLGRAPTGDARDRLTVDHLLSMRAGLQSTSGPNYGAWISSPDWVDAALAQPSQGEPGGRFIYSTGGWHVLGAALARASGMSLLEMARDWLGTPLDITFAPWVQDPQGRYLGGNEMALSPLALARVGQMALAHGRAGDAQVVPQTWLETSWQPRARSPWSGDAYGYGWFLTRFAGHRAAYGRGYGGQVLAVVPDLDLSIAITSDPTRPARSGGYFSALKGLLDATASEVGRV